MPKKRSSNRQNVLSLKHFYVLSIVLTSCFLWYFHFHYIYRLFENDKHFSHLSNLERELSFRTEMGLYYSYFKDVATESSSFYEAFRSIIFDNRTEAPTTINVLERFNLYPEVFLAFFYRIFNSLGQLSKTCYQVNRGESMSPVLSCEGHQEPTYFYVTSVFLLNGFLLALLFLFGVFLSKSYFGGILTVSAYLFNHSEATRVMWTPPLRENFSFPFHILQLFVLTWILQEERDISIDLDKLKTEIGFKKKFDDDSKDSKPIDRQSKKKFLYLLIGSTILYMLPWQFAQFTLATQILSLGLLYIVDLLPLNRFFFIVSTQIFSLMITGILMFGNRMLLTSLFSTTLFSFVSSCLIENSIGSRSNFRSFVVVFRRLFSFLFSFVFIKFVVIRLIFSSTDDDAHIWDIFKSKLLPTFRTFDTQLYTCAKEFDFIDKETIGKLASTGLLPLSFVVFLRLCFDLFIDLFRRKRYEENRRISHHFHLIQTTIYVFMGVMIMRLKLFPVPQLCLLISLTMNEDFWPKKCFFNEKSKFFSFIFIFIVMGIQGRQNISNELKIKGEYSNLPMEKLIEWVNENTRNDSIFAGTMPTMANLKLSTGRSIVVHPHYEHKKIRRRVKLIYSMFSRKPLRFIHSVLKDYQVDYYVYESYWCTIDDRPRGCSFPEMYDLDEEDPRILKRTTLACQTLQKNPQPYFQKVFSFDYLSIYAVL